MKIYTRTGDKGKTSLMGGKRVSKSDPRVEAYGSVDELNSVLGVSVSLMKQRELHDELVRIQHDLFAIGSYLADPAGELPRELEKRITEFEQLIDRQTQKLPGLRNFILPGGGQAGASLHHARTVCRRVERQIVLLMQEVPLDEIVMKYLNRLSDLLFSTARYVNHLNQQEERIWKK